MSELSELRERLIDEHDRLVSVYNETDDAAECDRILAQIGDYEMLICYGDFDALAAKDQPTQPSTVPEDCDHHGD